MDREELLWSLIQDFITANKVNSDEFETLYNDDEFTYADDEFTYADDDNDDNEDYSYTPAPSISQTDADDIAADEFAKYEFEQFKKKNSPGGGSTPQHGL